MASYWFTARPENVEHQHPYLVFDCQDCLHLPLTHFAKVACSRLDPKTVPIYLYALCPYFTWLSTNRWQVREAQTWDAPPTQVQRSIDDYLIQKLRCQILPQRQGWKYVKITTGTKSTLRIFLAALKLFYQVMREREMYSFANPLVDGTNATITAAIDHLEKAEDEQVTPRMPAQSGVQTPATKPNHRLTDSYYKLEHEEWKTQIAVEFAYQHRQEYQHVLWVLADTRESLVSGYIVIAQLLGMSEKNQQDQAVIVQAVKSWLQTHGSWLLILDNADELAMAYEFLPPTFEGHLLMTTRARATGTPAHRIEVEVMPEDVGALFLLHRAKLVALEVELVGVSEAFATIAKEICKELGGLPLALDQAGAYIEEVECSLQDYQQRYRNRRASLLKRRGEMVKDHPDSVAATWSLSFEKVEQRSPAAADLLRVCAHLSPDAIAEEIVKQGAGHLGPSLAQVTQDDVAFDEAVAALLAYSLIRRNVKERTLSMHRLVQAVLKDVMDEQMRRQWAEQVVLAVNEVFPGVKFETWPQCERYLPHALVCADLIEQRQIMTPEAASMLHKAGTYLIERVRYKEAGPLLQQALHIRDWCLDKEEATEQKQQPVKKEKNAE